MGLYLRSKHLPGGCGLQPLTKAPAVHVRVWCCPQDALDAVDVETQAWALVSPAERTQLEGLAMLPDGSARQCQALLVRALCRRALSAASPSVAAVDWPLDHHPSGAPFVHGGVHAQGQLVSFSLSHTAGMVVCVTCAGGQVGVDIEATSRAVHVERIAKRLFAAEEYARIMAQSQPATRTQAFLILWTLKEAYLKLLGLGLRHLTPQMAFRFDDAGDVHGNMAQARAGHIHAASRLVEGGHRLGLVIETVTTRVPSFTWVYGWSGQSQAPGDTAYRLQGPR